MYPSYLASWTDRPIGIKRMARYITFHAWLCEEEREGKWHDFPLARNR